MSMRLIQRRLGTGDMADTTKGARHSHTAAIQPSWAARHEPTARIENHVFYNSVPWLEIIRVGMQFHSLTARTLHLSAPTENLFVRVPEVPLTS